jgi:hypothetical protein
MEKPRSKGAPEREGQAGEEGAQPARVKMTWPQIIFGWPTILVALGSFGVAFGRQRSALGFVGVIAATPFLWYASHAPRGEWFSPALFMTLGAAAVLIRRGRRGWAAVCLAPFVAFVLMLAATVAAQ